MGRGSSGIGIGGTQGGAQGGAQKLAKALKQVEDSIRWNSTESAVALDENGNILFTTSDGQGAEVSISVPQQRMAYGQTMTHNHPHGYYFSDSDILVAINLNLKEMRATTPDGRAFVLTHTSPESYPNKWLYFDYQAEIMRTAQEASDRAWKPGMTKEQFSHQAALEHTKIMNEWLKQNAPKYGYEFREE